MQHPPAAGRRQSPAHAAPAWQRRISFSLVSFTWLARSVHQVAMAAIVKAAARLPWRLARAPIGFVLLIAGVRHRRCYTIPVAGLDESKAQPLWFSLRRAAETPEVRRPFVAEPAVPLAYSNACRHVAATGAAPTRDGGTVGSAASQAVHRHPPTAQLPPLLRSCRTRQLLTAGLSPCKSAKLPAAYCSGALPNNRPSPSQEAWQCPPCCAVRISAINPIPPLPHACHPSNLTRAVSWM
jgi:hypothetical protein